MAPGSPGTHFDDALAPCQRPPGRSRDSACILRYLRAGFFGAGQSGQTHGPPGWPFPGAALDTRRQHWHQPPAWPRPVAARDSAGRRRPDTPARMSWRRPAALDRHRTLPDTLGQCPRLTAAPIVTPERVAGRDAQSNPRQPSSQKLTSPPFAAEGRPLRENF